jgi:hypothetical protein
MAAVFKHVFKARTNKRRSTAKNIEKKEDES